MAINQVSFTYKGLIAGAFTPFKEDFSINTDVIPKYANYLADSGVLGVLVNGTGSEGPAMTVQERKALAKAWKSAVQQTKQHLMVQVAGCPLPDAQELARHAEQIGADSILCLPELYFKPKTPQDLVDYFKFIAQAAPNTPLLYYHTPLRSGVDINMEQFLNLAVDQLPTFHGVKFALRNLSDAYDASKVAGGRYTVMSAADTTILPALTLGFNTFNTLTSNFLPGHQVKIVEAFKENRIEDARKIQEKLTAAVKVITRHGDVGPTMKAAMKLLTPIDVGPVRPPQKNITETQIKEMEAALKQYVIL